jgi:uroporphyrinogen decarboxylase
MRSKERVLMAINHQEPDRVPLDFAANPDVVEALCHKLGIEIDRPFYSHCYDFPEALLQRLRVDLRVVRADYIGPPLASFDDGSHMDRLGILRAKEGYPIGHPLSGAKTVAEIEAYPWPDPDAFDYEHYAEQCERVEDYAVCGGDWCPFFTWAHTLMGTEEFLTAMFDRPELVHAVLGRLVDYYCETSRRMFEAAKGRIDIFFMGDDYGTQIGPFISPRHFRKFIVPQLKRLYDLAKSYGLKVMQHTCGSVRAILPDLITAGMDILDPIQVRAKDMDVRALKRDFGDRISFHGSIDIQHTMPKGTSEDVRQEVLDRLTYIAPGGGLIISGSHHYLHDIPLENIITVYNTVFEYGGYARR